MTRFVMLGTSELTLRCTRALLDSGMEVAALIALSREMTTDVEAFAKQHKISYHEVEDINSWGAVEILRRYAPDYMLSSWSQPIGIEVMNIPKIFIGAAPTHPYNNHPLHWLIMLGITRSHLSFFSIKENAIEMLSEVPFTINSEDTIADVMRKVNDAGSKGTKKIARMIKKGELVGVAYKSRPNWRERTLHDATIDPRMSGDMIVRIVRSCTRPYSCAKLIINDAILNVVYARTAKGGDAQMEQGRIVRVDGHVICFKADDVIVEAACENIPEKIAQEKHIHPPSYYLEKYPELREKLKKLT